MSPEVEVDGSFFAFSDGWLVEKVDEWREQHRVTGEPFRAKCCDIVALHDGVVWLVEAKDYTYPGARVPSDLHSTVAKKMWDTLALMHAVAQWGSGDHREFSRQVLDSDELMACLAMELPDGGLRYRGVAKPLADVLQELKRTTRPMGLTKPVVSNSFMPASVPWTVRRDPSRRVLHRDR